MTLRLVYIVSISIATSIPFSIGRRISPPFSFQTLPFSTPRMAPVRDGPTGCALLWRASASGL